VSEPREGAMPPRTPERYIRPREIIEAGMANGGKGATVDNQVFGANVCPIRLPGHDRSPHAHRRWIDVLKHRWPTALGVAIGVLTVVDLQGGTELAALTMLMPVVYLGAAALDLRPFAWAVLLAGVAVLTVVPSTSQVVPSVGFLVAALVLLVVGVARGQWRSSGGLGLQTVGMLAFGSIVLAALYVEPDFGGYLVAFALLGHAAWDALHYLRDRVVARSYAEFCAVLDLLAGVAVLFILFMT
jgi:hypothetical protein